MFYISFTSVFTIGPVYSGVGNYIQFISYVSKHLFIFCFFLCFILKIIKKKKYDANNTHRIECETILVKFAIPFTRTKALFFTVGFRKGQ